MNIDEQRGEWNMIRVDEQLTPEENEFLRTNNRNMLFKCIYQRNGQRILESLQFMQYEPPEKCEVYITGFSRTATIPDIFPVFENFGCVKEFRLMMDFSGSNRGFAFVKFTTPQAAVDAINGCNGMELMPGLKLQVCMSIDNKKLFIGGLPQVTDHDVKQEFDRMTEGITEVVVNTSNNGNCYAIISYQSHKMAASARRYLMPREVIMFGRKLRIDWVKPKLQTRRVWPPGPQASLVHQMPAMHYHQPMAHYHGHQSFQFTPHSHGQLFNSHSRYRQDGEMQVTNSAAGQPRVYMTHCNM